MSWRRWIRVLSLGALVSVGPVGWADDFTFTILHTNDLHSHCDPTTVQGKSVGGYARQATALVELRENSVNPILLNGGDTFQGTLFFNVYEGLSDLAFMNLVGYDAMCAGNHEFDKGVEPFANFIRMARFPVLAANLDLTDEPALRDLIEPSVVIDVAGEKVGIVGAVTPDLPNISSPGPNVRMKDYIPSVQRAVDELTSQGVNKIIMLTHCGFDFDQSAAMKIRGVDVVVGGHSHTLLGQVDIPEFNGSRGQYPTTVRDAAGQDVLVVQAWEWGKAIGQLELTFNEQGTVIAHNGAPVLIDDRFPEDPYVKAMFEAFRKPIESLQTQEIAVLETDLPRSRNNNLMGFVVADAVLEATKMQGSVAAFWNAGGVRTDLKAGPITYGNLIEVCPFNNSLVVLDLKGLELLGALEQGFGTGGTLIPSKGFSYAYDGEKAEGSRVSATLNGEAVDPEKTYRLTFSSFTSSGGDSHFILRDAPGRRVDTGFLDIDALVTYFKANSPVSMTASDRMP